MSIKKIILGTLATILMGYGAANADAAVKKKAVKQAETKPVISEVKESSNTASVAVSTGAINVPVFAYREKKEDPYTYETRMNGNAVYVNPAQVGTKNTNMGVIYPIISIREIDENGNADGKITSDEINKYAQKPSNGKSTANYIKEKRKDTINVQYKDKILTAEKEYEAPKSTLTVVAAAKPAKEKKNKEYKEPKEGGLEASLGVGVINGTPFLDVDAVVLKEGDYSLEINGIYGGKNSGPSTSITDGNVDPITGFYSHGERTASLNESICGYGAMVYKKLKAFSIGAGITNYNINTCEDVSTIEQIRRGTNVLAEKTNAYSTSSNSIEPKLTLGAKFGSTKEGVKAKMYIGQNNPALSVQYYRKFGK